MRLDRKIAIVTGGLSGIGQAVARRMVDEGATVVAGDIASGESRIGSSSLTSFRLNIEDSASVDALIRAVLTHYGRLDCLVNSTAIGCDTPFLETGLETFDRILAVNLRGSFIVGKAAARAMSMTGGGSIVNVASVSGVAGTAGRSADAASNGGVIALSRAMAVDLAGLGIRVNVLAPGPVETPLVAQMHHKDARTQWIERTPMHRYADPAEIAAAAVFLCSDDASFVTGDVLAVDGGFLAAGLPVPDGDHQLRRPEDTFAKSHISEEILS